jgi:hypothetical protein
VNHDVPASECDGHTHRQPFSILGDGAAILQWGFIVVALGMLYYYTQSAGPAKDALADMFAIFVSIVLEALPFMLLGSLAGGMIEVFVPQEKLRSSSGVISCLRTALPLKSQPIHSPTPAAIAYPNPSRRATMFHSPI